MTGRRAGPHYAHVAPPLPAGVSKSAVRNDGSRRDRGRLDGTELTMAERRWSLALAALMLVGGLAGPAAADVTRRFGGTMINCDAASTCAASLKARGEPDKASLFVLTRAPDQRARWKVMLSTPAVLVDRARPVSLSIDNGVDISLRPGSDYDAFVRPSDLYVISQSALDRLMLQIQSGHDLRFAYIDVTGAPHTDRFPLDGLAPALAEIDTQQKHIIGDRRAGPPVGLPPAPDVDAATAIASTGVPPRLADWHLALGDCEAPDSPALTGKLPLIASLSDTSTLYALPCYVSAAGTAYRLYEIERGEIGGQHRLLFASFSDRLRWMGTETLFDVNYDAKARRLTGRPLDETGCALDGAWTWDAFAFRLDRLDRPAGCSARNAKTLYPADAPPPSTGKETSK